MLLVNLLSYGFHIGLSYGEVSLEAERLSSAAAGAAEPLYPEKPVPPPPSAAAVGSAP
jgi:hypothetical protein